MSSIGLPSLSPFSLAHENGDIKRQVKRRHVQGILDETDPVRMYCSPKILSSVVFYKEIFILSKILPEFHVALFSFSESLQRNRIQTCQHLQPSFALGAPELVPTFFRP